MSKNVYEQNTKKITGNEAELKKTKGKTTEHSG
jgi:hypothetical protein